eukprot:jgi/Ulvmu1/2183/UM013_0028.1
MATIPAKLQSGPQLPKHALKGVRRAAACRASAPAAAATGGLVLPLGGAGAWDAAAIHNPVVRVYQGDNEQRWFMWYTGRASAAASNDSLFPAAGKIGVAVSSDGVNWKRGEGPVSGTRAADDAGACMESDGSDWWTLDTHSLAVSDVQMFSSSAVNSGTGVYWMFYTGCDYDAAEVPAALGSLVGVDTGAEGLCGRPGLAMSQDGRNWARIEADHHTHALFDRGEEGEWDALFVGAPQVLAAGPKDMRLWYHSYDAQQQRFRVGLATSEDGFKWDKQGPVFEGGPEGAFDGAGVGARCVVRDLDSRQYFMFYEGFSADGRRSIGVAVSEDGRGGWQRHEEPVLRAGEGEAWDAAEVGAPCAVAMAAGKWRLYYAGRAADGVWGGIGVALSEDGQTWHGAPTKFRRRDA